MILSQDADVPAGWEIVTLRGGPFARVRMTVPKSEDQLKLYDDADEHEYYRLGFKPEFTHSTLVNVMFGKRGAK